jgi:hypothetical protein
MLLEAIRQPDYQEPDPRAGRERYWLRCRVPFPFRWLRVVVEFAQIASSRPLDRTTIRRQDPQRLRLFMCLWRVLWLCLYASCDAACATDRALIKRISRLLGDAPAGGQLSGAQAMSP